MLGFVCGFFCESFSKQDFDTNVGPTLDPSLNKEINIHQFASGEDDNSEKPAET